jgi:hypothetical protein
MWMHLILVYYDRNSFSCLILDKKTQAAASRLNKIGAFARILVSPNITHTKQSQRAAFGGIRRQRV